MRKEAKEKPSQFYDQIYQQGGNIDPASKTHKVYLRPPDKSPYYPVWKKVLYLVKNKGAIADFGCGPGQFAQLALRQGFAYSYGIDFSPTAIDMAKARNPEFQDRFEVGDLYDPGCYARHPYEVAVFIEVLEHIDGDLKVLSFILPGKQVVFTVPNYNSPGHVRAYSRTGIMARYKSLLRLKKVLAYKLDQKNIIYICEAVKR